MRNKHKRAGGKSNAKKISHIHKSKPNFSSNPKCKEENPQLNMSVISAIVQEPKHAPETISTRGQPVGWTEKVRFWIEFVGCIFAGGVLIAMIFQSCQMTKATNATVGAVKISQGQVDVMKSQLEEMKSQTTLEERAFVFPSEYASMQSGTNLFSFFVHIQNAGKTPALNIQTFIVSAKPGSLESGWIPEWDEIPKEKPRTTIIPGGGHIIQTRGLPGPPPDGTTVYGTVWYDDIFGNSHWSQFCRIYTNHNFIVTGIHNSCDYSETNNLNPK